MTSLTSILLADIADRPLWLIIVINCTCRGSLAGNRDRQELVKDSGSYRGNGGWQWWMVMVMVMAMVMVMVMVMVMAMVMVMVEGNGNGW